MDYLVREVINKLLFVECMEDDNSFNEEDCGQHAWLEAELWPEGGRVLQPKTEGPGI